MRSFRQSLGLILVAFALVAASCASSDSESAETTDSPTGTEAPDGSVVDTGEGDTRNGDVVALDGLEGEELVAAQAEIVDRLVQSAFECTEPAGEPSASARGVTEDTITIRYIEADLAQLTPLGLSVDLGTSGLNQQAFYDKINACGGINGRMVDFETYVYDVADIENGRQICTQATVEDKAFLVVSRVLIQDLPLCVTEANETLLFMVTAGSREHSERSGGLYVANGSPEDVSSAAAIDLFVSEGVLTPETILGLIWGDVADQTVLIDGFMRDALNTVVASVVETPIEQPNALSCAGHAMAVQQLMAANVDTVLATFGGPCYGDFVIEATSQGFFPQYLTIDKSGMTTDVGTAKMPQAGDGFEGALGVTMAPGARGSLSGQTRWLEFCNDLVEEQIGTMLEVGSDPWNALAAECSAAFAIVTALQNAGSDLTQDSFLAAIDQIDAVPSAGDVILGGFDEGLRHSGNDVAYLVGWTLDCACWNFLDAPRRVDVSFVG